MSANDQHPRREWKVARSGEKPKRMPFETETHASNMLAFRVRHTCPSKSQPFCNSSRICSSIPSRLPNDRASLPRCLDFRRIGPLHSTVRTKTLRLQPSSRSEEHTSEL